MHLYRLTIVQLISEFGRQVAGLALPLIAVLILDVTPMQLGILRSLEFLPFVTVGLLIAYWIDKAEHRTVLIFSRLGNILVLIIFIVFIAANMISFETLIVVTFLAGIFSMLFELAIPAYLPLITGGNNALKGYSRLTVGKSIGEITGPALGGLLIQIITAPLSLLVDILTSSISVVLLLHFPRHKVLATQDVVQGMNKGVIEGFRSLLKHRLFLPIIFGMFCANIFDGILNSIILIYLAKDLSLSASAIGVVFATGSIGGFLGALIADKVNKRIGFGTTFVVAAASIGIGRLLIPLAELFYAFSLILALAFFLTGFSFSLYGINLKALTQNQFPNRMLARVFAAQRFIGWGSLSIGLFSGGLISNYYNFSTILTTASIGLILSSTWLLLSPLRTLKMSDIENQ